VEDTNSDEQQRQEYVSHSWSSEAQWRIHARLDPEHGAIVQSAVETIARAEGSSQAAALVRMADRAGYRRRHRKTDTRPTWGRTGRGSYLPHRRRPARGY